MTVLPTDPTAEELHRLARHYLRPLSRHPDYEDLVQEAWWRSWRDVGELQEKGKRFPLPAIVRICCKQAVTAWFTSYKALQMRRSPRRRVAPLILFLEDLFSPMNDDGELLEALLPEALILPDSSLPLLVRLSHEQQAQIALAAMTKVQRETCRLRFMEQEQRLGERLGCRETTIWRRAQGGLKRGRAALEAAGCD